MDNSTGRFISSDPAQQGINWYVYCNSNPSSNVDPTGTYYLGSSLASNLFYSDYLLYSGNYYGLDFFQNSYIQTYNYNLNYNLQSFGGFEMQYIETSSKYALAPNYRGINIYDRNPDSRFMNFADAGENISDFKANSRFRDLPLIRPIADTIDIVKDSQRLTANFNFGKFLAGCYTAEANFFMKNNMSIFQPLTSMAADPLTNAIAEYSGLGSNSFEFGYRASQNAYNYAMDYGGLIAGWLAAETRVAGTAIKSELGAIDGVGNTRNIIGQVYENYLKTKLESSGAFRNKLTLGKEFDGAFNNVWYEAKGGNFWNNVAMKDINKWKSEFGLKASIAKQNNMVFHVYSENAIPQVFKDFFTKKGITFFENF